VSDESPTPLCPKCFKPMELKLLVPLSLNPGFSDAFFRCDACDESLTRRLASYRGD
jgi:hypothetical protein